MFLFSQKSDKFSDFSDKLELEASADWSQADTSNSTNHVISDMNELTSFSLSQADATETAEQVLQPKNM